MANHAFQTHDQWKAAQQKAAQEVAQAIAKRKEKEKEKEDVRLQEG